MYAIRSYYGVELAACSGDGDEAQCDRIDRCAAGKVWRELSEHIDAYLTGVSLEQVLASRITSYNVCYTKLLREDRRHVALLQGHPGAIGRDDELDRDELR